MCEPHQRRIVAAKRCADRGWKLAAQAQVEIAVEEESQESRSA
jgi:hypothetical protein